MNKQLIAARIVKWSVISAFIGFIVLLIGALIFEVHGVKGLIIAPLVIVGAIIGLRLLAWSVKAVEYLELGTLKRYLAVSYLAALGGSFLIFLIGMMWLSGGWQIILFTFGGTAILMSIMGGLAWAISVCEKNGKQKTIEGIQEISKQTYKKLEEVKESQNDANKTSNS